jgi:hypothetical protein
MSFILSLLGSAQNAPFIQTALTTNASDDLENEIEFIKSVSSELMMLGGQDLALVESCLL